MTDFRVGRWEIVFDNIFGSFTGERLIVAALPVKIMMMGDSGKVKLLTDFFECDRETWACSHAPDILRDEQIDLLKGQGAIHVLNCTSDAFSKDMAALVRELKPRIFLDAVANQQSAEIFDAMPSKSRWIIYGKLDEELPTLKQPGQLIFQMKQIEGFWLTRWMTEKPLAEKMTAIQSAQKRFASGEWQTDVTAIISLDDVMEKLPAELAKPNGKVFIRP